MINHPFTRHLGENTARRPAAALLAGTLSLFALASGAACRVAPASSAGFTGDPLVTGSKQVAARGQIAGGAQTGASVASVKGGVVPTDDDAKIARITTLLLSQSHYLHKPVDDSLSPRVFDAFLDWFDPRREFFLQSDVDEFAAQYRNTIVGLTAHKGDFSPARLMYQRFLQRATEQTTYADGLLKDPTVFTFTGDDTLAIDRKTATRPATEAEAQALWREQLRYEYLQEKLAKTKPDEIVKALTRRYDRTLRSFKETDSDDLFEQYMNTIAHALDPHTDYFGKASAEQFSIQMKLSLFGIGATLRSEDGYTVIQEVMIGSPAQKTKKLKIGDKIVGVAQGDGAFADVVDMKLNRVVEQIRGEKGTVVRLKVIPADAGNASEREEIAIVRDEIKLDDQGAKARLIELPAANGQPAVRVGVIDLPIFYQDTDKNKSCSADVKTLLTKLQAENVSGVILNLRNNGGGSLPEAIKLAGLFIKTGPVVQVRDYNNKIHVDNDTDPSVTYDGPLIVLTSRGSASASEIVTGALQDYDRALIVGDASTFGKGSVQALVNIGPIMDQNDIHVDEDPGQLKLTIQKFYRPSGSSTQLKGVTPDVVLPSVTDALKIGEKDLENPMPWDTINASTYSKENRFAPFARTLAADSAARVAADSDWQFYKGQIARVAKVQNEKTISLNEAARLSEQADDEARAAARQKVLAARPAPAMKVYIISLADAVKPGLPKALSAQQLKTGIADPQSADAGADDPTPSPSPGAKKKKTLPEPDLALNEAERILRDYAVLSKTASPFVAKRP